MTCRHVGIVLLKISKSKLQYNLFCASLLSRYLGPENMLAVVCKTLESVKAMESFDKEGFVNKYSGIHGLGASIGQTINGRFRVICLEPLGYMIFPLI